jgi:hypothetical protein
MLQLTTVDHVADRLLVELEQVRDLMVGSSSGMG